MSAEKLQNDIDALLTLMNDDIEGHGALISTMYFDFRDVGDDAIGAIEKLGWGYDDLCRVIKICNSRQLLSKPYPHFNQIKLTDEGQSRAISVKHGKNRSYELGAGTQIATLTINGPAQVGNGNTQNFSNCFNQLMQEIENTDAPEAEKAEAKGRLAKLLEHPLVSAVVGGAVSAALGGL